jgi:hypothetical protein
VTGTSRQRSKSETALAPGAVAAFMLHGPSPGLASPPDVLGGPALGVDSARLLSNASRAASAARAEARERRRASLQHLVEGLLGCSDGGSSSEMSPIGADGRPRSASVSHFETLGCQREAKK